MEKKGCPFVVGRLRICDNRSPRLSLGWQAFQKPPDAMESNTVRKAPPFVKEKQPLGLAVFDKLMKCGIRSPDGPLLSIDRSRGVPGIAWASSLTYAWSLA